MSWWITAKPSAAQRELNYGNIDKTGKNKRDSNGVLTGRPGTVYDVNIKYTAPDGQKKSYAKKGFATKKETAQHEAEMKTKLQNPGQIASIASQRKQTPAMVGMKKELEL